MAIAIYWKMVYGKAISALWYEYNNSLHSTLTN